MNLLFNSSDQGLEPVENIFSLIDIDFNVVFNEWNALIEDKKTIVIDVRNNFEVEVGSFEGSINPKTKNFSGFKKSGCSKSIGCLIGVCVLPSLFIFLNFFW